MKKQHIFLAVLLLIVSSLSANNQFWKLKNHDNSPQTSLSDTCKTKPPTDFHTVNVGTSWVEFAWTPVDPSAKHRIRTFRASDNLLLNTTIVNATITSATITGLPSNTDCYSVINAVCNDRGEGYEPNGPNSPPVGFRVLILDVITVGYDPGTIPTCIINTSNHICSFPASGVTSFRVTYTPVNGAPISKYFWLYFYDPMKRFKVAIGSTGNDDSQIKFFCDNTTNPECSGQTMSIKFDPGNGLLYTIGVFDFGSTNQANKFIKTDLIGPNATVERLTGSSSRPSGNNGSSQDYIGDRGEYRQPQDLHVAASPNPFSNALDVFIDKFNAQNIHLQLFDLSGRIVLDQQEAGGLQQYTLGTESMPPGFYMLRVNVDGEVQTLKVVKSE